MVDTNDIGGIIGVVVILFYMSVKDHRYSSEIAPTVAKMSRLAFEEADIVSYDVTFTKIMDMFETMDQCDTSQVKLSDFIVSSERSLREDVSIEVDLTDYLKNKTPYISDGYFKVPKVIE